MKKIFSVTAVAVVASLVLAGCSGGDVVLKYSPDSFEKIVKEYPELVKDNTETDHYYYLSMDQETTLKISHDYSMTTDEDILLETPLKPFTDAGLDVSKIGSGYKAQGDVFSLTGDFGEGSGKKDNVTDAIFDSVTFERSTLTYHQDLDHYGIGLSAGKFEFAKDYKANDKDIVFVIKAKPLAELGVDVQNIDGWIFKTMKDIDGSDIDVLLKPYDL